MENHANVGLQMAVVGTTQGNCPHDNRQTSQMNLPSNLMIESFVSFYNHELKGSFCAQLLFIWGNSYFRG
jgi:hypothetical protein